MSHPGGEQLLALYFKYTLLGIEKIRTKRDSKFGVGAIGFAASAVGLLAPLIVATSLGGWANPDPFMMGSFGSVIVGAATFYTSERFHVNSIPEAIGRAIKAPFQVPGNGWQKMTHRFFATRKVKSKLKTQNDEPSNLQSFELPDSILA